jgi:hypothetical protein
VTQFELNAADKRSPLWMALSDHLRDRLAQLRQMNDHSQPVEKTERLRGQIYELKALLALENDRPAID